MKCSKVFHPLPLGGRTFGALSFRHSFRPGSVRSPNPPGMTLDHMLGDKEASAAVHTALCHGDPR